MCGWCHSRCHQVSYFCLVLPLHRWEHPYGLTDHSRCLQYPATAHLPSPWTTEFIPEKLSHGRVMVGISPVPADGCMISVLPACDNSEFHFSAYWAIWKYIQLLVLSFPESNSVEALLWERLGKKQMANHLPQLTWLILCDATEYTACKSSSDIMFYLQWNLFSCALITVEQKALSPKVSSHLNHSMIQVHDCHYTLN